MATTRSDWRRFVEQLHRGEVEACEALCRRELLARPESSQWNLGLSWVLMRQGRNQEALTAARLSAGDPNGGAAAFRTLATILLRLDNLDAAQEAAQHALQVGRDRASFEILNKVRERLQQRGAAARVRLSASPCSGEQRQTQRLPVGVVIEDAGADASFDSETGEIRAVVANAQLSALFGATLFGAFDEAKNAEAAVSVLDLLSKRGRWRRLLVATGLIILVAVAAFIGRELHLRNQHAARTEILGRIERMLISGVVEQLAALLDDPQTHGCGLRPDAGGLPDLYWRAQATVFRYHDADPERLTAIRSAIPEPPRSYDQVVTAALIASGASRVSLAAKLEQVRGERPSDPQAAFFAGLIALELDDLRRARKSIEQALAVDPANQIHLSGRLEVAVRAGRWSKARGLLGSIFDVNPYTEWAKIAERRFTFRRKKRAAAIADEVLAAFGNRARAELLLWSRGRDPGVAIGQACELVSHQEPFLLDWAAMLLVNGRPAEAHLFLSRCRWPQTPTASWIAARIYRAGGEPAAAKPALRIALAATEDPHLRARIMTTMAVIASEETRDAEALALAKRAALTDPANASAKALLAILTKRISTPGAKIEDNQKTKPRRKRRRR